MIQRNSKYNARYGANYDINGKCNFFVWAPFVKNLSLCILDKGEYIMKKDSLGGWHLELKGIKPGTKYLYRLENKKELPDPASYFQGKGVFGPSETVNHINADESPKWKLPELHEMIIYELHVGTFTSEGTFYSAVKKIDYLKKLGINAIELMPVAQSPGSKNWGYDGVFPYAVQNTYGGPAGLKRFIKECHKNRIAVILDVVYNHLGPEGCVLHQFMPVFTDKYQTPWGKAVNFDDAYCCGVREYFIQNALYWLECFNIDALRLDAVHGIFDMGAKHILSELSERVDELSLKNGKKYYLIAESDLNDIKIIESHRKGGFGLDAQWNDDYHHCLHSMLTKETEGYYADFGKIEQIPKSINKGFVYSWDYSGFRKRMHGSDSTKVTASKFVVFSQNHDQVGNRKNGERLSMLAGTEAQKLAAGMVLISPFIPLLFMGEEYDENSPFLYFMDFRGKELVNAVREGRKKEFKSFKWQDDPPDPHADETYKKSKLKWEKLQNPKNIKILSYYKKLIEIRKIYLNENNCYRKASIIGDSVVKVDFKGISLFANFGENDFKLHCRLREGKKLIDSSDTRWNGPGVVRNNGKNAVVTLRPKGLIIYEN